MRHKAAERPAEQVVGADRLDLADKVDVVDRHLVDRVRAHLALDQVAGLQSIDRLVGRRVAQQLRIRPAEAAGVVDAEQRPLAAHGPDRQQHLEVRARRAAADQPLAQGRHVRRLEQAADRKLDVEARLDAADQTDRQQRMAAELEEVVVDADPLDAQHLREQPAQDFLLRRARQPRVRAPANSGTGSARRSSLPFGVSGRRSQHDQRGRHHVLGQACAEIARAAPRRRRCSRPAPRSRPGASGRARPRARSRRPATRSRGAAARPRSRPARRAARAASPARRRGRGTRARRPAATRARSPLRYIRLPGGPYGIGDEALRGQPRSRADSRGRAPRPRCRARRSRRQARLKPAVEHVGAVVRHRPADRDVGAELVAGHGQADGVDGGLGRAVQVGDAPDMDMTLDLFLNWIVKISPPSAT